MRIRAIFASAAVVAAATMLFLNPVGATAQRLDPPGLNPGDQHGSSVARSSEWLASGSISDDRAGNAVGAIHIWRDEGFTRTYVGAITPSDAPLGGQFGYSVAIDGNTLVAGAPFADGQEGAAYVFVWNGSSWNQQQKLTSPTPAAQDWFGWSVDIRGDQLVVGAVGDDTAGSNRGAAYVWTRSGGTWAADGDLISSTAPANASGGYDVAISDIGVLVGYPLPSGFGGNGPGFVTNYEQTGPSAWSATQTLASPAPFTGDNFGVAVSADGNRAVIGASGTAGTPGAVHVFDAGTTWAQTATIAPTPQAGARVGFAVDVSGDLVLTGAFGTDDGLADVGRSFLHRFESGTWTEVSDEALTGAGAGDFLGRKVALDGANLVVGAPLDDAAATNGGAIFASAPNPHGACQLGTTGELVVDELIDDDGSITPDRCSLREAILLANMDADPDDIVLGSGLHVLSIVGPNDDLAATGDLDVTTDITIRTADGADATSAIIDGQGIDRIMHVHPSATLRIEDVTLRNGDTTAVSFPAGGAAYVLGRLELLRSHIHQNHAVSGAGLYFESGSTGEIDQSAITHNVASDDGGGIESVAGTTPGCDLTLASCPVVIRNTTVSGNVAWNHGGISNDNGTQMFLNNVTIVNNHANSRTGGLGPGTGGLVFVANSIISDNTADTARNNCDIGTRSLGGNFFAVDCEAFIVASGGLQPTDDIGATADVGPLGVGGSTTPHHVPNPGSDVIDTGASPSDAVPCETVDQRGEPRTGDCDSGAIETGDELACTITGTDGDDVLTGTPGNDVICGLRGSDTIHGLGGNDIIRGGRGADMILGGDGDDILIGGRGADIIEGNAGDDVLRGRRGSDTLRGGVGHDELRGGRRADVLLGGDGDDVLVGGRGSDDLDGGTGIDACDGEAVVAWEA